MGIQHFPACMTRTALIAEKKVNHSLIPRDSHTSESLWDAGLAKLYKANLRLQSFSVANSSPHTRFCKRAMSTNSSIPKPL